MMRGIKAGDAVYLVERGKGTVEKVAKVGRKFFTLETQWARNSRFRLDNGYVDSGYTRTSRCWRSQEEYEASERQDAAWEKISQWFRNRRWRPNELNEAQMREIAKVIGVEL
jgi:hypothetical protein